MACSKTESSGMRACLRLVAALVACALAGICAGGLAGCGPQGQSSEGDAPVVRIGTMPTEDILPAWVAQDAGYFTAESVQVELEVFDSAQSLSSAITAGQVDMAMTDVMRAVKLCESGTPVVAEWVTLGTEADQGRFGLAAAADAPYDDLAGLAAFAQEHPGDEAASVGVAANTVPEYVFDRLVVEEGLDAAAIPTTEVASLPERYGLASSGKIGAAALPNSLLTLAEQTGCKVLAQDTDGDNLSQSIMVARTSFADEHEQEIRAVANAWDRAVEDIDRNPDDFKELLFQKSNINADLTNIYVMSTYPSALDDGHLHHPAADLVWPQIEWMRVKGYGAQDMTYDGSTGVFSQQ